MPLQKMEELLKKEFIAQPFLAGPLKHVAFHRRISDSIPHGMMCREKGNFRESNQSNFEFAAENLLLEKNHEEVMCQLPGNPRSTFLMVFSPDGTKVASTHGDHNIYVTDTRTGKCLRTLMGHPRTPWCIAFHPYSNEILASGCLGGEVRVWDLHGGSEVWTAKSHTVIASLAFHPTERILVVATYNELYFWDWNYSQPFTRCHTGNDKEKIRFVCFDPLGQRLITGIANRPYVQTQWDQAPASASSSTTPTAEAASIRDRDRNLSNRYNVLLEQYDRLLRCYRDLNQTHSPFPPSSRAAQASSSQDDPQPGPSWASNNEPSQPTRTDTDMHYGLQLLSQHIDNLQRICRDRVMHLQRRQIVQLHQIRRILEDLQRQIRSLRSTVRDPGNQSNGSGNSGTASFNISDNNNSTRRTSLSSLSPEATLDHNYNRYNRPFDYYRRHPLYPERSADHSEPPANASEDPGRMSRSSNFLCVLNTLRSLESQRQGSSNREQQPGSSVTSGAPTYASVSMTGLQRQSMTGGSVGSSSGNAHHHHHYQLHQRNPNQSAMARVRTMAGRLRPLAQLQVNTGPDESSGSEVSEETSNIPDYSHPSPSSPNSIGSRYSSAYTSRRYPRWPRMGRDGIFARYLRWRNVRRNDYNSNDTADTESGAGGSSDEVQNPFDNPPYGSDAPQVDNSTLPSSSSSYSVRARYGNSVFTGNSRQSSQQAAHVAFLRQQRQERRATYCCRNMPHASPFSSFLRQQCGCGSGRNPAHHTSASCPDSGPSSSSGSSGSASEVPTLNLRPEERGWGSAFRVATPSSNTAATPGQGASASNSANTALSNTRQCIRTFLERLETQIRFQRERLENAPPPSYGPDGYITGEHWQPMSAAFGPPRRRRSGANNQGDASSSDSDDSTDTEVHWTWSASDARRTLRETIREQLDMVNRRARYRQVLAMMVDSLTEFFEQHASESVSTNSNHEEQMYHLFLLLRVALQLTCLIITELQNAREVPEERTIARLPNPFSGATTTSPSDTANGSVPSHRLGPSTSQGTMAGAFYPDPLIMTSSCVALTHRIQVWDFAKGNIPNISDPDKNVVVKECKIHNDASVSISPDGHILATLLPGRFNGTAMLGVYSLKQQTLGTCLYTSSFEQNAVSVSLSPTGRHILVGLASRRTALVPLDRQTIGQVFRLEPPAIPSTKGRMRHIRDFEQMNEHIHVSLNCLRWAPLPGQGIVYGTNMGHLKILR